MSAFHKRRAETHPRKVYPVGDIRNPGVASTGWPNDLDPEAAVRAGAHRDATGKLVFPWNLTPALIVDPMPIRKAWMREILVQEERLERRDAIRLGSLTPETRYAPEFERVGGGVVCDQCGFELYDHPEDPRARCLRMCCEKGKRVKL